MSDKAIYRATGKRKTSVARVTLTPGTGTVTCNGRPAEQYFDRAPLRAMALSPLVEVGLADRFGSLLVAAERHGVADLLVHRTRRDQRATDGVVDDLGIDVLVRAKHGQPWPFRGAADVATNAVAASQPLSENRAGMVHGSGAVCVGKRS